jgi:hypothetical protein
MAESRPRVTQILRLDLCDPAQAGELLAIVYDELRLLARRQLQAERAGHTLEPTALAIAQRWRQRADSRRSETRRRRIT